MNDEQRRQLYEVLDYDEKTAVAESFSTPKDALKLRVTSKLNKGSFGLRADLHGETKDIVSVVFDVFRANFTQRPEGFDASISLGGFEVHDGTTKNTLYPQIVRVKELTGSSTAVTNQDILRKGSINAEDPFFYLKFEKAPLDERADTALTVRMRHMEIIYHRGIVEAVNEFFRPPSSQLESVEALLVGVPLERTLFLADHISCAGCCQPNFGGSQERDPSGVGTRLTEAQDSRRPNGPQCSDHHHSGRVGI